MGCCQSSPGNVPAAFEAASLDSRRALPKETPPPAYGRPYEQRTDRLLLVKAVAAEFEHPAIASVDDALLGVLKRDVLELAQPRSHVADLMREPVKTGPCLEDYYGYEPGPGIERGIARRRVEELVARTDPATQARLLAADWTTLDWHERRKLLEQHLEDELSWSEVVRRDVAHRSAERSRSDLTT